MSQSEKIKKIFDTYAREKNFSGVGLVKKGNEKIFHQAYGYSHRGFKVLNNLDTRFDTASITKLFTATAILQLVDQNRISLDDRLLDIIEIGPNSFSKDITIYHLLTHTSGIGDDADEEAGENYAEIWKDKPNYSVRETLDYLPQFINKEPNFKPGEGCRYNNCGYILLGLVIETISGKPFRDFVRENIFERMGMENTDFYAMDEVSENVAEHYASMTNENDEVTGYRKNIYSYPPIGAADAGALTTAQDLDLFIRSLKDGKLLSEHLTKEMFQPQVVHREHQEFTELMGYGFQFLKKNDTDEIVYIQKDGINTGVSCILNFYPDENLTILILSNQESDVWDLAWDVQDVLIGEIL